MSIIINDIELTEKLNLLTEQDIKRLREQDYENNYRINSTSNSDWISDFGISKWCKRVKNAESDWNQIKTITDRDLCYLVYYLSCDAEPVSATGGITKLQTLARHIKYGMTPSQRKTAYDIISDRWDERYEYIKQVWNSKLEESFSYSKLNTYDTCSFGYYLKYVLGNYADYDTIETFFGTAVHACEEQIANSLKEGLAINYDELVKKFDADISAIKKAYPKQWVADVDDSNKTWDDKANIYKTKSIYRLEKLLKSHPEYSIVGAEIPFSIELCGQPITGFIDRVLFNNNTHQYIVQDIKTRSKPYSNDKLSSPLQLFIYQQAVINLYGCKSKDVICEYDLPICNFTQVAGYKFRFDDTVGIEKISNILSKIKFKEFKCSPSPLCYWCQFSKTNPGAPDETKHLCPYCCHWTKNTKDFSSDYAWSGIEKYPEILKESLKK